MSYHAILYESAGGVARLTLNRPERLNSLDGAMHAELRDALARVAADGSRVLVVTGAGWGNKDQKAVLRPRVEAWLRGPEGRALGVKDVQRVHRDGALEVLLR